MKFTNFRKIAKYSNFEILQAILHTTHLLTLLDKMWQYEIDPTRPVGATERTWDAGWTDRRMDGQSEATIPPTTSLCGGYNQRLRTEASHCNISNASKASFGMG